MCRGAAFSVGGGVQNGGGSKFMLTNQIALIRLFDQFRNFPNVYLPDFK